MKRKDLIDKIESLGCVLIRHGPKHDIYHNPKTGMTQPIPRHREINEFLAKKIVGDLSDK
jgi:predicted RNA binding protein YcfA (HicA-like mRNA interferase family)